ncbi:MAG TPA: hypothetical protein VH951_12300 [Dehalococcoidia bacterium]|jgi:hypothetical protein
MIYEERRITVEPRAVQDFLKVGREETWPRLKESGGALLCLMGGMIGAGANELVQISRFEDLEVWERSAGAYTASRSKLVRDEVAQPLRAVSSRPRAALSDDDKRPVYGYRRFYIRYEDIEDFSRDSEQGVWVRFEAHNARILGLWTTIARTEPQEIILATGYTGPGHWEATRGGLEKPAGFDEEAWRRAGEIGSGRGALTLRSSVNLMRAIEWGE